MIDSDQDEDEGGGSQDGEDDDARSRVERPSEKDDDVRSLAEKSLDDEDGEGERQESVSEEDLSKRKMGIDGENSPPVNSGEEDEVQEAIVDDRACSLIISLLLSNRSDPCHVVWVVCFVDQRPPPIGV